MGRYKKQATQLTGHELAVSLDDRRQAFWLHQKFTSRTYVRQLASLYASFVAGYQDFVKQTPGADYRHNLAELLKYRNHLQNGVRLVEAGQKSGYEEVYAGCFFFEYLSGRRFEFGLENEKIGWRQDGNHVGLYAWAGVATGMAWRTKWAVSAQWAFPAVLTENSVGLPPAEQLPGIHVPYGPVIPTDEEIPVSGIWEPVGTPGGCPSYLGAGWPAPKGRRATVKYEGLDLNEDGSESFVTRYEYGTEPTGWQLMWEDQRYEGGQDPDESRYLDASTAAPPWPAVYVAPDN